MTPGSILYDQQFVFRDKTIGNKLLIVLNDSSSSVYVIVKTTSKQKHKNKKSWCQANDKPPNFFLPKGSCWFDIDTWIELNEFFEIDLNSILNKKLKGILRHCDSLPKDILKDLLICAINCDDITEAQIQILQNILDNLS